MNSEVDRSSPTWAHTALCADLTWAAEPPDDFIRANQRLLAQHCRITQILQDTTEPSQSLCDIAERRLENGTSGRRSVKETIPESRLAQFYGNFYYDDLRESCYTNPNETRGRPHCNQRCENTDVTECWMLPEVEYWFRKLIEEPTDRSLFHRRRRQYRMTPDDDFERWGPIWARTAEEASLAAKVRSVRSIWQNTYENSGQTSRRTPSPPQPPRKIRARRRQPRRLSALAPPPPVYCLDAGARLVCDSTCKFDNPRPTHVSDCQRVMSRYSASMQALMRATAARCPLYRGTNVSRYAPTGPRPLRCLDRRCSLWWPRDTNSTRQDIKIKTNAHPDATIVVNNDEKETAKSSEDQTVEKNDEKQTESKFEAPESPTLNQKEILIEDDQVASTSTACMETELRKKRLYSTVLSMSPPTINISPGCVRLSQKLATPGILKLNSKTRLRTPNVDNKYEELEKEALEQYKASDESIDTKFKELEKEAVEQYSTSNSNTSCSSGHSAEKKSSNVTTDSESKSKRTSKFHKEKSLDSVVIYSQNFPDLNARGHTSSVTNLKNWHAPPRGEKKEQSHRPTKTRSIKNETQSAASDTDYEARNSKTTQKAPMRWMLHMIPSKKRHLSACASDFSSDEDIEETSRSLKDAGPCIKTRLTGKAKLSAHGGGDLNLTMRKT
ncbi:uncharacterized protein LOC126969978 isoform X2 [Leptidea sinapis]|uniref:uncharacterized protein LOC126969978 isoform X2 n=1 Tax=Leptidea sinapis TaxID=189913 RepID=UPI0021C37341|nr:uncharacterized protein LOC126969978 isoform X2 [Leptidea sinapis]